MRNLRVSTNHRFLVEDDDNTPFFYLADTAWELFHRLTKDETLLYLRDRAEKSFTVVQAVALAEFDGLTEPNREGHLPLHDNDPARPSDAYFRHVDWVIKQANRLGLVIGLLPSWGDKVNRLQGKGPEIFTPPNAHAYGEFLGRRYRDKSVIWIVGGDRSVDEPHHALVWRAMAAGLRKGDNGRHLITFHPRGGRTSATDFHNDDWLDFNMLQSGHGKKNIRNDAMIAADYARTPIKPCLDAEPCYENHPVNWHRSGETGWFDAYDARKAAYRAVFAGACGHTYGCHDVWQFLDPARHKPVSHARTPWPVALDLPGANQMRHLRALIESRPFLSGVPDQSLLALGKDGCLATRGDDKRYAFVYTPNGAPFGVRLDALAGAKATAAWFDPRTGKTTPLGSFPARGTPLFTPPLLMGEESNDWVLVLDKEA